MRCPKCNSVRLSVIDSRSAPDNEIRRRRKCRNCGYRFSTYEMTQVSKAKRTKIVLLNMSSQKKPGT